MSRAPSLDSLGEIYRGFKRDRALVKAGIEGVDGEWIRIFEELRVTRQFFRSGKTIVARETMRILLALLPPSVPARWHHG